MPPDKRTTPDEYLAHSRELFDMPQRVVYVSETKDELKYAQDRIYRPTIKEAYALMDKKD